MNINGKKLEVCSKNPLTGYNRSGYCNVDSTDVGTHVVCAKVTPEFLEYTKSRGNDLITPSKMHRFPGLKPGDKWCLCALRWKEAESAGYAPPIIAEATHKKVLDYVKKDVLSKYFTY